MITSIGSCIPHKLKTMVNKISVLLLHESLLNVNLFAITLPKFCLVEIRICFQFLQRYIKGWMKCCEYKLHRCIYNKKKLIYWIALKIEAQLLAITLYERSLPLTTTIYSLYIDFHL